MSRFGCLPFELGVLLPFWNKCSLNSSISIMPIISKSYVHTKFSRSKISRLSFVVIPNVWQYWPFNTHLCPKSYPYTNALEQSFLNGEPFRCSKKAAKSSKNNMNEQNLISKGWIMPVTLVPLSSMVEFLLVPPHKS